METKYNDCEKCGGLGYYPVANGPDDYETVECGCFEKVELHPMPMSKFFGISSKHLKHLIDLPSKESVMFKGGALGKATIAPF